MLKDLDANRARYRKDPAKVEAAGGQAPAAAFRHRLRRATRARQALARRATAEQRKRFIDAFYHSLLHNYGTALVDFTGDRLKVFPGARSIPPRITPPCAPKSKRSNGTRMPVNYSLRKTPEGWKAWDVVIEGISYVKSSARTSARRSTPEGLDAVIERIEKGGTPVAVQKTSA